MRKGKAANNGVNTRHTSGREGLKTYSSCELNQLGLYQSKVQDIFSALLFAKSARQAPKASSLSLDEYV